MRKGKKTAMAVVAQVAAISMIAGTTSPALASEARDSTVTSAGQSAIVQEVADHVAKNQPSSLAGNSAIEDVARQLADHTVDPYSVGLSARPMLMASGLRDSGMPAQFDLRDVDGRNFVTPVKFQNPFGTCWGFAAISACETSILGNPEIVADEEYDEVYDAMDLSEKHLAYFVNTPYDVEDDPQYGEGMYYAEGMTTTQKLSKGGFPFFATSLFASGMGPIRESYDESLVYRGANGLIQQRDGVDFCYSAEDDWDIDSSLRHVQSYELAGSYILPSPAGRNGDEEYVYNPAGTQAIKEQLLQKRGVSICFYADSSRPGQELGPNEKRFIDYEHWAHYTDDPSMYPNHAVTIIGWDDNYSKENFQDGHQPPEDGAWLVKNSWGSAENEFPNRGRGNWGIKKTVNGEEINTGYFWLSYYDMSLSVVESFAFDQKTEEDYYVAQYDLMPVGETSSAFTAAEVTMVNLFDIDFPCKLSQVSCQTVTPGTTVTYRFYLLDETSENPTDGVKIAEFTSGPYRYGGFHKETVSPEAYLSGFDGRLEKGQVLAIAATQIRPDGYYIFNTQMSPGKRYFDEGIVDYYMVGVINPGESYLLFDGDWYDYSSGLFQDAVFGNNAVYWAFDNFPIKGYFEQTEPVRTGVDFGGFEDVAKVFYDYLTHIDPENETGILLDGSTVSFQVSASYSVGEAEAAIIRLAENALRAAIEEGSLPESYRERFIGVGSKPLDEYSGEEEWKTEGEDASLLPEESVFQALWAEPIRVAQILTKVPACGTVTATPVTEEGYVDWAQQTNRPEAVVAGEHFHLDDRILGAATAWLSKADPECEEPFSGTMRGNSRYAYAICLAPNFGYVFTEKTLFMVNGRLAKASLVDGGAKVVGTVKIAHHWDNGTQTVRPGFLKGGVVKYSCEGCGSAYYVGIPSAAARARSVAELASVIMKHLAHHTFREMLMNGFPR